MNITEPAVAERAPQPYVSIPRTVTMATISSAADELPGLFGWLADHGVTPSGPPFLRYNLIDMERELQIEAGVPVPVAVATSAPLLLTVMLPVVDWALMAVSKSVTERPAVPTGSALKMLVPLMVSE